jgi:hypothetical protein
MHLEPGTHRVAIRLEDGRHFEKDVFVSAGESSRLSIEAPPKEQQEQPEKPTPVRPAPELETGSGQSTFGYVTLGLAAASATGAVVLGVFTVKAVDDFKATGNTDSDLHGKPF